MQTVSRRTHLQGLLGMAALAGVPRAVHAEDPPIPPQGIGQGIKHLSYSDIGGRPDSIQIMSNRKHLYVGHMFSDGVTILDASDPRKLKPVPAEADKRSALAQASARIAELERLVGRQQLDIDFFRKALRALERPAAQGKSPLRALSPGSIPPYS